MFEDDELAISLTRMSSDGYLGSQRRCLSLGLGLSNRSPTKCRPLVSDICDI